MNFPCQPTADASVRYNVGILMAVMWLIDCIGTDTGPSHDSNPASRYEHYRAMYTNCTHVLKNLEIVFLDGNDTYDLSFLSEIREVRIHTEPM
jgi:hypothetical protein